MFLSHYWRAGCRVLCDLSYGCDLALLISAKCRIFAATARDWTIGFCPCVQDADYQNAIAHITTQSRITVKQCAFSLTGRDSLAIHYDPVMSHSPIHCDPVMSHSRSALTVPEVGRLKFLYVAAASNPQGQPGKRDNDERQY